MKSLLRSILLAFLAIQLSAQKKVMTPEVYQQWNKITKVQLSDSGNHVSYVLTNEGERAELVIYDSTTEVERRFSNVKKQAFTTDENFLVVLSSVDPAILKAKKKAKIPKSDLPKDTLTLVDLRDGSLTKLKNVTSFELSPGENYLAYKTAHRTTKKDSTLTKNESEKTGTQMVIRNLDSGKSKAIAYVMDYTWAKEAGRMLLHTTGPDSLAADKVLLYDGPSDSFLTLSEKVGTYSKFQFAEQGDELAFIYQDTTAQAENQAQLYYWKEGLRRAKVLVQKSDLEQGYKLSLDEQPRFLKNFDKLIYGIKPILAEEDTTLLAEEKVDLEIWNYKDGLLHTQQEVELKKKNKESLICSYDLKSKRRVQLTTELNPTAEISDDIKGKYILSHNNHPYQKYISWEGNDYKDLYKVDLNTGQRTKIATRVEGRPNPCILDRVVPWDGLKMKNF